MRADRFVIVVNNKCHINRHAIHRRLPPPLFPPSLPPEFERAGVDLHKPMVATCGSGITAAVVAFAAYMLGKEVPVYDVSLNIVTGGKSDIHVY